MDRKKIIEEGLLEDYIMGMLSERDQAIVEKALQEDPELREQLQALEEDLEQVGFENAVEPSPKVRQGLRDKLEAMYSDSSDQGNKSDRPKRLQFNKMLVAASLAAFFALSSFWLFNQWQSTITELQRLEEQTVNLQERLDQLEGSFQNAQQRYVNISQPNAIPLLLVGNQISPQSKAVAYINHADKTVIVNSLGLVALEEDQTYQMWADVEGEMINMGLVPTGEDYIPLRYIDKAESLNITIEPAGGSEHPTVEKLISNIYL